MAELAIGIPGITVAEQIAAGGFVVVPGSPGGLIATGVSLWTQDSPGVGDQAEYSDYMGEVIR